jgi:hypothetical protein
VEWIDAGLVAVLGGLIIWGARRWIANAERQWVRIEEAYEVLAAHEARLDSIERHLLRGGPEA